MVPFFIVTGFILDALGVPDRSFSHTFLWALGGGGLGGFAALQFLMPAVRPYIRDELGRIRGDATESYSGEDE